jgi:hypothetical protein
LNLLAAICAALAIALLARTVALLPYDRTHDQRERERSPYSLLSVRSTWIPPVLAAAVCGLQLSFWENATVAATAPPLLASSEMLDLLFFAYVIRCLMEYRVDERESWLTRASLVYAIGMTNNWAMIAYFPLFIAALIRVKGFAFFEPRFLLRMFVWGFPGLLFYFVLPVISAFSEISNVPFWQALTANLGSQKYALLVGPFNKGALFDPNDPMWVLALPSLLPILIIAIRWPSFTGDTSRHGNSVLRFAFHLVHALFLVICVWCPWTRRLAHAAAMSLSAAQLLLPGRNHCRILLRLLPAVGQSCRGPLAQGEPGDRLPKRSHSVYDLGLADPRSCSVALSQHAQYSPAQRANLPSPRSAHEAGPAGRSSSYSQRRPPTDAGGSSGSSEVGPEQRLDLH